MHPKPASRRSSIVASRNKGESSAIRVSRAIDRRAKLATGASFVQQLRENFRDRNSPIMEGATADESACALTTVVMSTVADVAPRAKGNRLSSGWCASEEVQREIHEAVSCKQLRRAPKDPTFRSDLKASGEQLERLRASAVNEFLEGFGSQLDKKSRQGDQAGFYQHMKGLDVEGERVFTSQNIKYEDGNFF
ncbi:unnamed protein product, partial [Pylaiella littoralis]